MGNKYRKGFAQPKVGTNEYRVSAEVINRYGESSLIALMTAAGGTEKPVVLVPIEHSGSRQGVLLGFHIGSTDQLPDELLEALATFIEALEKYTVPSQRGSAA